MEVHENHSNIANQNNKITDNISLGNKLTSSNYPHIEWMRLKYKGYKNLYARIFKIKTLLTYSNLKDCHISIKRSLLKGISMDTRLNVAIKLKLIFSSVQLSN